MTALLLLRLLLLLLFFGFDKLKTLFIAMLLTRSFCQYDIFLFLLNYPSFIKKMYIYSNIFGVGQSERVSSEEL